MGFSLGQPRTFDYHWAKGGSHIKSVELPSLSYVSMQGNFQKDMKHGLPAEPEKNMPRINITWRWLGGPGCVWTDEGGDPDDTVGMDGDPDPRPIQLGNWTPPQS